MGEAGELWIPFAPRAGVRDGAPQPAGASSLWGVAQAEGPQGRLWTQELIDPLGSSSLSPRGLFFSPAVWLVGILVF